MATAMEELVCKVVGGALWRWAAGQTIRRVQSRRSNHVHSRKQLCSLQRFIFFRHTTPCRLIASFCTVE